MSTSLFQAKMLLAFAKRIENPNAPLTAAEEAALAAVMAEGKDQGGFPAGAPGDARGTNALRRSNWFNGRMLTAEALRRQDSYWDTRARLGAHLLMPGVAHGLGISGTGLNAMPVVEDRAAPPSTGGFGKAQKLTLSPGLAFDHVGRPILVSQPFDFTLEQLVTLSAKQPRRVAPGGVDFAPCVCLVPEPAGPSGGTPAVRPGPYLLVIEPGEVPEGEAKRHGEACAGPKPVTCEAESWRGAFGLSLARVPLELPEEEGLNTAWALRGTLSAWWFDVFEHSLIKRWDPDFARDAGFRRPGGPGRHEAGAVALAMVWLGTDGSAIFLDPWIPRRSISATPGEDWHRTRFGAPPRAAAWARIHQFQAMLAESVAIRGVADAKMGGLNLWQRGFRHIPPIGFLPLDPAAIGRDRTGSTGNAALDRLIEAAGGRIALVSGLVAAARQQAFAHFKGTNVLPYCVVALHDDDVLEDLSNVFDKDPVQVTRRAPREARIEEREVVRVAPANAFLDRLGDIFDVLGLDELVNRRTEIVKVVIPLQGLTRAHPVLGVVAEDARDQLGAWLGSEPPSWYHREARMVEASNLAGLRQRIPLEMLPRHFAVYVKQRMVLLEVLVVILELLQALVVLARDVQRDARLEKGQGAQGLATTEQYRQAFQAQPAEKRALAQAALQEPVVMNAVAKAATLASADLRVPARNAAFAEAVAAQEQALVATVPDAELRAKLALDRTADAYAAEHPGFAITQILVAVQPPEAAKRTIEEIRFQGAQLPLREASGTIAQGTVADRVAGGIEVFEKPEATIAFGAMRESLAAKDASAYVADAPAGLKAAELLAKPPEEAARLLGGPEKLDAFTVAVAKEREAALVAAKAVAEAPPVAVAVKLGGATETEALAEIAKARAATTDAKEIAALDGAAVMVRTLGVERSLSLARGVKG